MSQPAPEAKSVRLTCPHCAAALRWDPDHDALSCAHCGQQVPVPKGEATIAEYPYADRERAPRGFDLATLQARCTRCGAQVAFDENRTARECCFCGSPQVLQEASLRRPLRPESLIPLDVGATTVEQSFRSWVRTRWFRPSALANTRQFRATGVYVPFWTYDCAADSRWTALAGYYYYVPVTRMVIVNGKPTMRTTMEQRVRWEPASGARQDSYNDLLVHASQGLSRELAAKLGGFDLSKLVPYKPEYLAGWSAEEYSVDLEAGWEQALAWVQAEQRRRCSKDVPGDTQSQLEVQTHVHGVHYKHVLLPLWSLTYQFRGKPYAVLIHGQTGKVVGEAPYSWIKITLFVLAVLAGLAVVLAVLANAG